MRREVAVAVRRGDELLVVRRVPRKGGYWHLVAGSVETGEEWHDAAVRELREETGLAGVELRPVGSFRYVRKEWEPDAGAAVAVQSFAAEAAPGWEPSLNEEHDAYRWCGVDEACELLFWPEPRELLRSL